MQTTTETSPRGTEEPVGVIYVVSNETVGDEWTKVGLTCHTPGQSLEQSLEDRVRTYQTSDPLRSFKAHAYFPVLGCRKRLREAEKVAHAVLEEVLGKHNRKKEWFRVTPVEAEVLIRSELEQFAEPPKTPKVTITIRPLQAATQ